MTFTDDDLKLFVLNQEDEVVIPKDKFQALLARLEAAENLAAHDHCGCSGRIDLEDAWRKSAGK